MKIFARAILAVLVFLAVSSGITKIILMEQDVEFFGSYGFSSPMLIAFGVAQLIGGILLVFPQTLLIGASVVAVTFLISGVLLVIEGNLAFSILTFVCLVMLGFLARQNVADARRTSG